MERWAEITSDGARRVVTLEREFRTDPADLWQAITDPERASRWLASLTVEGDDVTIGFDGSSRSGKILECEAPHRLRVVLQPDTADRSVLAVTLEATNGGTKLVMQQDGLPPIWAALFSAGWQHHAERLDAAIGGSATETPRLSASSNPATRSSRRFRWKRLRTGPSRWLMRNWSWLAITPSQVGPS